MDPAAGLEHGIDERIPVEAMAKMVSLRPTDAEFGAPKKWFNQTGKLFYWYC
jgi:hypothetical protein